MKKRTKPPLTFTGGSFGFMSHYFPLAAHTDMYL